jgi:uncharacterized protein
VPDEGIFPAPLVERLRRVYALDWHGTHGWPHWVRVRENGLRLAQATGADSVIVELFALFHDIARVNEGADPAHGARGAAMVAACAADFPTLDGARRELLRFACTHHTDRRTDGDVTVQTCWDADRLDLGRVGVRPDPNRLCTLAARDVSVIAWAWRRSRE